MSRHRIKPSDYGEEAIPQVRENGATREERHPVLLLAFDYVDVREAHTVFLRELLRLCSRRKGCRHFFAHLHGFFPGAPEGNGFFPRLKLYYLSVTQDLPQLAGFSIRQWHDDSQIHFAKAVQGLPAQIVNVVFLPNNNTDHRSERDAAIRPEEARPLAPHELPPSSSPRSLAAEGSETGLAPEAVDMASATSAISIL